MGLIPRYKTPTSLPFEKEISRSTIYKKQKHPTFQGNR